MRRFGWRPATVSIDLGTAFVRVGTPTEPVAVERPATGEPGRPAPMRGGVIHDLDSAADLLAASLREAAVTRLRRLRLAVSVPATATSVERRAVQWVADKVGIRADIVLVEEPIAAAIGLGLDIADERPRLVVDVGHGITEAAVIASGDIVAVRACRVGCADLEQPTVRRSALARVTRCALDVLDGVDRGAAAAVDDLHLAGGGSLRPDVLRELAAATGLPIVLDPDPIHAVARGDALCALGSFGR